MVELVEVEVVEVVVKTKAAEEVPEYFHNDFQTDQIYQTSCRL
ncbi:hypothetical protein [Thermosyntropha lipolytica]|nr:hypothetical protein [Thermosyntropha lipolytica]